MQMQLGRQILYCHTLSTRQAAVAELLPGVGEQVMDEDTFLQRKASAAFLSFLPVPGELEETETTDSHPKDGDCVLRKQTRKPRSLNDLKEHSLVFPFS